MLRLTFHFIGWIIDSITHRIAKVYDFIFGDLQEEYDEMERLLRSGNHRLSVMTAQLRHLRFTKNRNK